MGSVPGQVKPKTYKINICCLTAKHTALMSKRKDLLAGNQNNMSEWNDMSYSLPMDCCFSKLLASNMKIQLSVLA